MAIQLGFFSGANLKRVSVADPMPVALSGTSSGAGTPTAPLVAVGSALPVTMAPAVTAALYTAGDCIGGKQVLANAVRAAALASRLESLFILDRSNTKPSGYILIFNADPAAATLTDKVAAVLSTDDLKVIARIDVSAADYITVNGKAFAQVPVGNLGPLKSATTTSLWAAFIALAPPTFAATTDLQIIYGFTPAN